MMTLSIKNIKINTFILLLLSLISIASPIFIHNLGLKGTEFLPIFFALSLGAYILNPLFLLVLSIVSPMINYFLTNMPMPPNLYFLIFEGIIFSLIIGLLKNKKIHFVLLTLIAFIFARLSSVVLTFIFDVSFNTWLNGFINGYKGIIINFLFSICIYFIFREKVINE